MASRFWVGGTGNWDAATTTHWSATSGGGGGASVPTSADTVTFDANSGTTATVTITAAAAASSLTLNKSDLTLTHSTGSTITGAVTLTTGTLNTNGQACSWGSLSSNNANTRTLTLGASAITITGTATAWNVSNTLTLNAGTSSITVNGAAVTLTLGALAYYDMALTGSGAYSVSANGSTSFRNFTRTITAVKTDSLIFTSQGITVTGILTLTGNSVLNRLFVQSNPIGTTVTLTAATVSLTNVDFMDIAGAGAAAPFTGTSLGDCLGNSNITFTAPATQTWSGNTTGNFATAANWTSRVPLPQDNVIVNGLTSGTITASMPRSGANIDFTGSTGSLSVTTTWNIFGNFTFGSGMPPVGGGSNIVLAGRSTQTFTSAGVTLTNGLTITAPGGTYTLQDAMTTNATLSLANGTLNTNNQACSWGAFASNNANTRTLTLGTSTISLTGTGTVWNISTVTGSVINASSSTILVNDVTAAAKTFNGGAGKVYGVLTVAGGASSGSLTFGTAGTTTFSTVTIGAPKTVVIRASSTLAVTALALNSSAGNVITITSDTPGTPGSLSKASGILNYDWLSLTDSTATGGATWYAGANSINGGGNSGWIFTAAPTVFGAGNNLLMMGVG